jgi:hypothetical protein
LDDGLKQAVNAAKVKFNEAVGRLDVDNVKYNECGRNFLKVQKIGPDAFMQLAFQVSEHQFSS